MSEEFEIENSYTLSVTFNKEVGRNKSRTREKIFNFLSCQVTTTCSESIFESHKFSFHDARVSSAGGASATAAVTQNVIRENFSDLISMDEVELMHKKLKEIGGTPPSLETVLEKTTNARKGRHSFKRSVNK